MRSRVFFLGFLLLTLCPLLDAGEPVRTPAVAGQFYPSDPGELSAQLDSFLKNASRPAALPGSLKALILPHAGYPFSGPVAAAGYKLLEGEPFDTVVLIGPCHHQLFRGADIWSRGSWQTPLGSVPVDTELAAALLSENPKFQDVPSLHAGEHSLEVQLPFLQKVLKNFKIVPILIDDPSAESTEALARALVKHAAGRRVLVIASTDMSHYHPEAQARSIDAPTLEFLKHQDAEGLAQGLASGKNEMCGDAAALTVLQYARRLGETRLDVLQYGTSAAASGDLSRVVGYGASAVFLKTPSAPAAAYSAEQRSRLLAIAHQTLNAFTAGEKPQAPAVEDPALKESRAVFVTLRKHGELRGCIGRILPEQPLAEAVQSMTVDAASRDFRFAPVKAEEVPEISIEISVLSLPRRAASAEEIRMGEHGVIVENAGRSGVFLPQVAEETGWTREHFLDELCSQKAGLPAGCWNDPATALYLFTAEAFGDADTRLP